VAHAPVDGADDAPARVGAGVAAPTLRTNAGALLIWNKPCSAAPSSSGNDARIV
jgi:hypothetical protein